MKITLPLYRAINISCKEKNYNIEKQLFSQINFTAMIIKNVVCFLL